MEIINFWGNTKEEVTVQTGKYMNGNLAIQLFCEDGPYATLTVNLDKLGQKNLAYVDTNNVPTAEQFITENKLGKPAGKLMRSGFCMYPLYEFDLEALAAAR